MFRYGSNGMDSSGHLWPGLKLPDALVRDLLRDNPWWEGKPSKLLPSTRRDFVELIHRRLEQKLAPIVVVRGPRQVGKTTAQLQVVEDLLGRGVAPQRILRVQFDELPVLSKLSEPILRVVDWYEHTILRTSLNQAAHDGLPAYLFFDEVQNLSDWAVQLKHLVDSSSGYFLVTGSSALRIEAGRDSLAGRINSIEVGTLSLREIAAIRFNKQLDVALTKNGTDRLGDMEFWRGLKRLGEEQKNTRDLAFEAFSERGGYPLVHERPDVPWPEVADQLNETVIRRVIQHDLRVGDRGRKRDAALLEEVFRLGCRYAGQTPSLALLVNETQKALNANVGSQRIRQYLDFLDRALLLRLVAPLEIRLKKKKGAPKICLADHGLRASWLQELIPLAPRKLAESPQLSDLAGRIAESVTGICLLTISGLDLSHFPRREDQEEIDFVITAGTKRIPVEVKYRRRVDERDIAGLTTFLAKDAYNAPFGVLVCEADEATISNPRIVQLPLSSVLLIQ